ncbi:MAG: helix-turn-helix domain-containing protein, partial [Pseudomonadota bacterium]
MGWVVMSERELNREEVLAQVDDGRLSVDNAAHMLALTRRQIFRVLKRYRQDGASVIRHKARGRAPNNQIHTAKRDYAEPDRFAEVFCLRDKRYVTKDLTLKYDRKRIRLEVNDLTRGLV